MILNAAIRAAAITCCASLAAAALTSTVVLAKEKAIDPTQKIVPPAPTAVLLPNETNILRVNAFDMPMIDQGTGPLLILVHGSLSDSRTWADVYPALTDDFRVVVPTLRYFGKSPWLTHWPPYSNDLLSDDLAALIRALKSGPAHLAGWSNGARVVHKTALAHPELVRSAFLYEGVAAVKLDVEAAKEEAAFNKQYWQSVRPAYEKEGVNGLLREFFAKVHGDGYWEKVDEASRQRVLDNVRTFNVTPNAPKTYYPCEQIKRSPVPTRLMMGTASSEIYQRMFRRYRDCMPANSIERISGATHAWPRNSSKAFVAAVKAFVNSQ